MKQKITYTKDIYTYKYIYIYRWHIRVCMGWGHQRACRKTLEHFCRGRHNKKIHIYLFTCIYTYNNITHTYQSNQNTQKKYTPAGRRWSTCRGRRRPARCPWPSPARGRTPPGLGLNITFVCKYIYMSTWIIFVYIIPTNAPAAAASRGGGGGVALFVWWWVGNI